MRLSIYISHVLTAEEGGVKLEILSKLVSSIDDTLGLILGEDLPKPIDNFTKQYPYLATYIG